MELNNQNLREKLQNTLDDLNTILEYCDKNYINCYIENSNNGVSIIDSTSSLKIDYIQQVTKL